MRVHWCRFIISNDQHSILGVQSMRNELMWGSFLGITIFTALTVLVSTAVSSDDLRCSLARMTSYDPLTASYETGFEPNSKVLLLCLLLSLIFLFTLQYLRLLKHLSVFVGCSGTPMQEQIICVAGKMYNLAALFHWLSMRLTFLLVAAVGWVFGPTYCLVSSFITVLYLSHTDNITTSNDGCYAPQVNESTVGGVEDGQNPSREV
uniref:Uncharacterized protein n=1 Tax=Hemiselmis tepida TaxID=464990 RepID=A0A7S0Z3D4_9CRYP